MRSANTGLKNITYLFMIVTSGLLLSACGASKEIELVEEMPVPDFDHDTPTGEITSTVTVDQTFTANCNSITEIELYGATYKRTNSGTVNIEIYTCDGDDIRSLEASELTEIARWSLNAADFQDNTLITLDINDAEVFTGKDEKTSNQKLKGKKCLLKISSPDGIAGSSITFWTTQNDEYPDGCIRIGGYEQYNDLWFQVIGQT